jgi:hypothetical protein
MPRDVLEEIALRLIRGLEELRRQLRDGPAEPVTVLDMLQPTERTTG